MKIRQGRNEKKNQPTGSSQSSENYYHRAHQK